MVYRKVSNIEKVVGPFFPRLITTSKIILTGILMLSDNLLIFMIEGTKLHIWAKIDIFNPKNNILN